MAKVLERTEQRKLKEASRRAFDGQAPRYDEALCGEHARSLYPAVLRDLCEAYLTWAYAEGREDRLVRGVPTRPFRVLDVGCGTGALAEHVLTSLPAVELSGVDISPEMLRRARRRLGDRASFVLGDSERLPFADGAFEAIICNDSFHHYPDPARAAFEMWRVLRPGGVLIIGDVWQPQPARAFANLFMPFSGEGDVRIYSEAEMRELLGPWFASVEWRQVSGGACVIRAHK